MSSAWARASRGQSGRQIPEPNQLLRFLRGAASKATNVILGTATPIQLDAVELWDLLHALGQGADQVLGRPFDGGEWMREESVHAIRQRAIASLAALPEPFRALTPSSQYEVEMSPALLELRQETIAHYEAEVAKAPSIGS